MCAAEAARRGRSVAVLDHGSPGRKLLASGGGRSNFTNVCLSADNYLSENPDFPRSALAGFTPSDIKRMLEKGRVRFETREDGQLFLKGSSRQFLDLLVGCCREGGARIFPGARIMREGREAGRFAVYTDRGRFDARSMVVATGGLSYPELGASDLGYRIASRFGLRVTPLRPALVPFTFGPEEAGRFGRLSGLSLKAGISFGKKKNKKGSGNKKNFVGDVLFTRRGISGPAVLQASLYWAGEELSIDLLPGVKTDVEIKSMLMKDRNRSMEMQNYLAGLLPRRFALAWCGYYLPSGLGEKNLHGLSEKEMEHAAHALRNWTLRPSGTEGYRTAEVTAGGVDTRELSSKTMESRQVPGLFFAGEVLDVTGELGGYNLHWAWASGCAAGRHA